MLAFFYIGIAYLFLPLVTLYSCFSAIYLLDFSDPDFLKLFLLWTPGIFLYYIYVGQLIMGQRLPFLDRIWGFPNLVRKHQALFRYTLLLTLIMHTLVHLYDDGLAKLLWEADLGLLVVYLAVVATILLMIVARYVWLKAPQVAKKPKSKQADYAKMHRLHQLFYFIAIGIWYHVVTAGAFLDNVLGQTLLSSYLLFAFACKFYMLWLKRTAPIYHLTSVKRLHQSFTRLTLQAPQVAQRQTSRHCANRCHNLHKHKPGQYAYFAFPLSGKKGKLFWEEHPFSLASYASADSLASSSILTIVVKELGDFSRQIANFQVGTPVRVTGPYGTFSNAISQFKGAVHLIAGGIGITPFLSILQQQAAIAQNSPQTNAAPLRLHWFVREPEELVFQDQFAFFQEKIPMLQISTYVAKFLTKDLVQNLLAEDLRTHAPKELALLYCGPPVVRPALEEGMNILGIPRRNLHSELFSM